MVSQLPEQKHDELCLFAHRLLQQPNPLLHDRYLPVAVIRHQLQIFNAVVTPNVILVVNNLPSVQTPLELLGHDQPMLKDIAVMLCHCIEEIVGSEFHEHIAMLGESPSLPSTCVLPELASLSLADLLT
jgi:hypothetical protein